MEIMTAAEMNNVKRPSASKMDAAFPAPVPDRTPSFTTAAPISFDRSSFTGPTFSPEDFLADRRHIALDRLKSELQEALRDLKGELVELINLDYVEFINLSTKLVGVDKMIAELSQPLDEIKATVQVRVE